MWLLFGQKTYNTVIQKARGSRKTGKMYRPPQEDDGIYACMHVKLDTLAPQFLTVHVLYKLLQQAETATHHRHLLKYCILIPHGLSL